MYRVMVTCYAFYALGFRFESHLADFGFVCFSFDFPFIFFFTFFRFTLRLRVSVRDTVALGKVRVSLAWG